MSRPPAPERPEEPSSPWLAVLVFLTTYAPLPILVAPRYLGVARAAAPARIVLLVGGMVVVLSAFALWVVLRSLRGNRIAYVTSAQAKPGDLLAYAIPYIASFVGFDFTQRAQSLTFLALLSLLAWIAVRSGTVFMNPWLVLLGYELYEVEYESGGRQWKSYWLSRVWIRPGDTRRVVRLGTPVELVTE